MLRLRGEGCCESKDDIYSASSPPSSAPTQTGQLPVSDQDVQIETSTPARRRSSVVESRRSSDAEDSASLPSVSHWCKRGGEKLEVLFEVDPDLGSAPVRLVDATHIMTAAKQPGATFQRRQDLPEHSFVDLTTLRQLGRAPFGALRILAVSHVWSSRDHPDPHGFTLKLVARALEAYVCDRDDGGQYGVFIDFCSLPQCGPEEEELSHSDAAVYAKAVQHIGELYSHPRTMLLKVTATSAASREQEDGALTSYAGPSPYHTRGWCYTEEAIATLTKPSRYVLDLAFLPDPADERFFDPLANATRWAKVRGACTSQGNRRPPMTLGAFGDVLSRLEFRRPDVDLPLVRGMYDRAFSARLGEAHQLFYSYLSWGDEEAKQLAAMLKTGVAERLEQLFLSSNRIGCDGLAAIIDALAYGASPNLREISLHENPQLSDEAITAARKALEPRRCYITLSDEFHIDQTARRRSISGQL